jgi:hypothetical protein
MDVNLARWIVASIAVYFQPVADSLSLLYFVEGIDERDSDTMRTEHVEVRVNGPNVREVSKNYWRVHIDINILLIDYMKMSSENAYDINQWGGKFLAAMTDPIPIYRFGSGGDDDDSLIGCLTQRKGFAEPAKLIHFGQISKEDRIRQAMVDGRFEMYLTM